MIETKFINRLKHVHPLFKPLMETAINSYKGEDYESYYLEFNDGIHHSLGVVHIYNTHDEYARKDMTKLTRMTLELFDMRTGRVIEAVLSYDYQFSINQDGGISKRIPTDWNNDNDIEVSYRKLTEDDIDVLESKNQSNHHVYFYKKEESSEDDEQETNSELELVRHLFLLPIRISIFLVFATVISSAFTNIISHLTNPNSLGIVSATLSFLAIPVTLYLAYKLTKLSKPVVNKIYKYFESFIEILADVIIRISAKAFSHFESTKDFSSELKDEIDYGVNTRSKYMINSDIAINQPDIREELNTIILLSNEPTTPYRLHEFLDMTKTSKTGKYNKLIFNFGDKGHIIKKVTTRNVDALSDTDYETKAIVDSCIAVPLKPQEVKHIILTIENVKKAKREEKEQEKSKHYYNKYKPQAQSRESEPSVFEQTLSEIQKDVRDDMEKQKDIIEKHKS